MDIISEVVNEINATIPVTTTELTCPHCGGIITIERPVAQRRGILAGIDLSDMDDEQLKREAINAKSVLYKAEKRGAGTETVEKNRARVEAVMAEKAKRDALKPAVVAAPEVEAEVASAEM